MELYVERATITTALATLGDMTDQLNFSDWQYKKKRSKEKVKVDISDMSLEAMEVFRNAMKENDEDDTRKVSKMLNSLKNTDDRKVTTLKDFPRIFTEYLKNSKATLLHSTESDLRGIAYLPLSVKYTEAVTHYSHRSEAYVTIVLGYNTKMRYREWSITLRHRDLNETVPAILARHKLMVPDESMEETFLKIQKRFEDYGRSHAEQFLCRGEAPVIDEDDEDRYWWRNTKIDLSVMGKPSKAVVDTDLLDGERYEPSGRTAVQSDIYGKRCELPAHPILPVFSLLHHKMAWVNVVNMKPYKYEENLREKLVLPKTHVRLIGALISNLEALRDENEADDKSKTIKAKASSSVILAKGPAGTGKTLTAEVYAEEIKRPLYEIQSGQIGTDPVKMEANLTAILSRSIRLRMPVLINEADVFIKKRGDNVVQNAIVSVFLRLLEYHNGLVFLTTNRSDDIDPAILSRCIAEIQYGIPAPTERLKLWKIMLAEFNVKMSKEDIRKTVFAFPEVAGRDIQNLIRLTNRVCIALDEPFTLNTMRENAAFKSIKTLNDKEIEAAQAARKAEAQEE